MKTKNKLHPRNQHREGYDFTRLLKQSPSLKAFIRSSVDGKDTIDFHDSQALRALNKALLKTYYDIQFWDIPDSFLCPPIPGRVDYIHYLADLLATDNNGEIPKGRNIKVLDIGTGANVVYPLIGQSEYAWHFTGVDIDLTAINVAKQICQFNQLKIDLKVQVKRKNIFKNIITPNDFFHLTLCNPPFHSSPEDAMKGTQRKWKNLGKGDSRQLNFGGQSAELWCHGGEKEFISSMIEESIDYGKQCLWFSSLVSKKDNLPFLYKKLAKAKAVDIKTIDMSQGSKVSRFIAWSFFNKQQRRLY